MPLIFCRLSTITWWPKLVIFVTYGQKVFTVIWVSYPYLSMFCTSPPRPGRDLPSRADIMKNNYYAVFFLSKFIPNIILQWRRKFLTTNSSRRHINVFSLVLCYKHLTNKRKTWTILQFSYYLFILKWQQLQKLSILNLCGNNRIIPSQKLT